MRDSRLTCKVANKCLNVRERVEVVQWNKRWSPPFPCCPVIVCVCEENPDRKKSMLVETKRDLFPCLKLIELVYLIFHHAQFSFSPSPNI